MWVKICANTSLEDAKLATELGADAVGFVFAESARKVTPLQVAEIVTRLPAHVEKIGVFTSCSAEEIAEVVRDAGLTGAQLHGNFASNLAQTLRAELGSRLRIIQTVHWDLGETASSVEELTETLRRLTEEPAISEILVDSKSGNAQGGTGVPFDWSAANAVIKDFRQKNLVVAGGLNSSNLVLALNLFRPWGVDVASGVESSPGRKDPVKLKHFLETARNS